VIVSGRVERGKPVHRAVRGGDIAIHTRGHVANHLRHKRSPSPKVSDQWLATTGLSTPPGFIASLLHRVDTHHGLLHGSDGVL